MIQKWVLIFQMTLIIELKKDWAIKVTKLGSTITELAEHRQDIIHDVRGILEQDEHFVPRI